MARYSLYAILSLFATILSVTLFAWWSPLFVNSAGNLPAFLYWQQTFDATLDQGWQGGYYPSTWGSTAYMRFLARVLWLYRNNCYAFQYFQLGADFDQTQWQITRSDDAWFIARGPNGRFNTEYDGPWGIYKFGWKAFNYTEPNNHSKFMDPSYQWGPSRRVPVCFTVNPLPIFATLLKSAKAG